MTERIFIGVAWPYADGPLHLGHIAGAYLPADIFARMSNGAERAALPELPLWTFPQAGLDVCRG